jgi:FtsH-binding integral membrane protein
MGVSWLANYWASSGASAGLQYLGLALFVVAQSIIFVPLLFIAYIKDPTTIPTAGVLTLCVFGGLTAAVFITRKDFSFLGPILCIASFLALGVILVATFFSPSLLGLVFCFAMVALASGYIIYDTSNILHRYRTDQHVAASLALFASVALLFWYILQILMLSSRRN